MTSFRECLDMISTFCVGKKEEHEICSHAQVNLAGAQLGAKEQSDKLLVLRVLGFYIQALFLLHLRLLSSSL